MRHLDPTDPNFNGQHDDPNASNLQGHTALFLAIDHNQPMTVYTLLRLGANPKLPNRSGFMAIHQAAYQVCCGDPCKVAEGRPLDVLQINWRKEERERQEKERERVHGNLDGNLEIRGREMEVNGERRKI